MPTKMKADNVLLFWKLNWATKTGIFEELPVMFVDCSQIDFRSFQGDARGVSSHAYGD